jgi:hypothetical protein
MVYDNYINMKRKHKVRNNSQFWLSIHYTNCDMKEIVCVLICSQNIIINLICFIHFIL